jgi:hypothetical protein
MPDKEWMRTLVLAGVCLILPVYNWHYIIAPSHRAMTLLILSALLSGAVFYELTMRDASMEWVLAGILGVMGIATVAWIALLWFSAPLANDHTPLVAARDSSGITNCAVPPQALQIILGGTRAIGRGNGPFTAFRTGICAGPSVTRTPGGLLVSAFGYDDDGTLVYRLRNNQFEPIQEDYLHLHRTDRSTLSLYDKRENEIFYLRYLNPGAVRVRGRFLCGETRTVVIRNDEVTIAGGRLSQPPCITLKPGSAPGIALQTH